MGNENNMAFAILQCGNHKGPADVCTRNRLPSLQLYTLCIFFVDKKKYLLVEYSAYSWHCSTLKIKQKVYMEEWPKITLSLSVKVC